MELYWKRIEERRKKVLWNTEEILKTDDTKRNKETN